MEAVILDVGGVFFLPGPERIAAALEAVGLVPPTHRELYSTAHYRAVAAQDRLDDGTGLVIVQTYLEVLGVPPTSMAKAYQAVSASFKAPSCQQWTWVQAEAVAALRRLAAAGLGLAVVSNSDGHVEHMLLDAGICQVGNGPGVPVGRVVDSAVVGVEKPDPAIFTSAVEAVGAVPERCLYVGDTVTKDVRGARAAGLRPLLIDPVGEWTSSGMARIESLSELADVLVG